MVFWLLAMSQSLQCVKWWREESKEKQCIKVEWISYLTYLLTIAAWLIWNAGHDAKEERNRKNSQMKMVDFLETTVSDLTIWEKRKNLRKTVQKIKTKWNSMLVELFKKMREI